MEFALGLLLLLVNAVWLCLVVLGLPGNWLMVLTTSLLAWWRWDPARPVGDQMFSPWTLAAMIVLAFAGEILEVIAGAAGAQRAGAGRRGTIGSLIGTLIGAVAGTFLIPIPLIGSLIGAAAGAAIGAWSLELTGGRPMTVSLKIGAGAGVGRFMGIFLKLITGAAIWLVAAIAAFWP